MSYIEQIDRNNIPTHIAVIMDGNGRWAKQRGLDRFLGHKNGLEAVRNSIKACTEVGVSHLTLYTFSTENWNRPIEEVDALMDLMVQAIANETQKLIGNNVKLQIIGNIDRLPQRTREALDRCLMSTAACTGLTLILALSYSSKWEITQAVQKIAAAVKQDELCLAEINETLIANNLETAGIPDPDLLIRTGGEKRISNFLMWQIAYSELYFTDELWPDFDQESLYKAIYDYQFRERRYGKTSEQINPGNK